MASIGSEGAAPTCHRVCAALGEGVAAMRSAITVTPEASAASASLRLAVRSSARGSRHSSTTATPTSPQRVTSAAARSTASASGSVPRITCAGESPISTSPGACSCPPRFSASPSRSQTKVPPILSARAAVKPVAQPASSASAAKISCSRARISPPPNAASMPACPVRAIPAGSPPVSPAHARSIPAIRAFRDSRESRGQGICSYYVPFRGTSNACATGPSCQCGTGDVLLTLHVNSLLN